MHPAGFSGICVPVTLTVRGNPFICFAGTALKTLIFRWFLSAVDDDHLHRPFRRLQLQPKLLLYGRENRRTGRIPRRRRSRTCRKRTKRTSAGLNLWSPLEFDVIKALSDVRFINNGAAQLLRKRIYKSRKRDADGFKVPPADSHASPRHTSAALRRGWRRSAALRGTEWTLILVEY